MKRKTLICLFVIIICSFYFSIPKEVFGQQPRTLAEEVFEEYKETFKHPDIQKFFPPVLLAFKSEVYQSILNSDPELINRFVIVPNSLRSVYQDVDNSIIELLTTDTKFRELFQNPDFHNVLQDTTAIDQLAELIENIQIPTEIVKFSGDSQSGTPDSLLKSFIVVVKDQNDKLIEGISVTFSVISGDGELSDSTSTTDGNGQASTIFTLGQTLGPSLIEASVEGTTPVIFTAIATQNILEIVYGNGQEGAINTTLPHPFIVKVSDQNGNAIPDIQVTFRILSGESGQFLNTMTETDSETNSTTNSEGLATTQFILGAVPGYTLIEASVKGAKPVIFTATATTPSLTLEIVSGNGQKGDPGTPLNDSLVVEMKQNSMPVDSINVVFEITKGNGNLELDNVLTDPDGRAQTLLTLGPNEGINEVTATVTVEGTSQTATFIAAAITTENIVNPQTTLEIISGNEQKGAIDTILPDPFIVKVSDQNGNAIPEVPVTFRILYGSGQFLNTMTETNSEGLAATQFILGVVPGVTLIEAHVDGAKPVIFTATATPPPLTLKIISGNGQEGAIDTTLPDPFIVKVSDQNGNAIPGSPVTFRILSGGSGQFLNTMTETDSEGLATTQFILGANPGYTLIEASVEGAKPVIFTVIATPPITSTPPTLEVVAGNGQEGAINTTLPHPFIVKVSDQNGNAIHPGTVTFRILYGESGQFLNTMTETDSDTNSEGLATTQFILGAAPGYTLIEASVDGAKPVIFTATAITSELFVNITPSQITSPAVGKKFTLNVNIIKGESINGYVITVKYDPTALDLKLEDDNENLTFNGEYLPDAHPLIISESDESSGKKTVTLAAPSPSESSGDGILAKLTFEVVELKESTLELVDVKLSNNGESLLTPNFDNNIVTVKDYDANVDGIGEVNVLDLVKVGQCFVKTTGDCSAADVNEDGNIDILDLVAVVRAMGVSEDPSIVPEDVNGEDPPTVPEDVNGDGVVNILDIVAVAAAFEDTASAPSIQDMEQFNVSAKDVRTWLTQAKAFNPNISEITKAHPIYQRGIAVLENLLATLTQIETVPQKTALLLNYPNPFNPETWIPYQLAESTDVTVTIHAMNGSLIRTLSLGHQSAGLYRSKSRAAYWDGKNAFGEQVASGLYFYTLTAGKFSATGKMLIRK